VVGVDRRAGRRGERAAAAPTLSRRILARRMWVAREALTVTGLVGADQFDHVAEESTGVVDLLDGQHADRFLAPDN
jgi:hypothetical protein